ncbi:hypothetical protein [uncultured Mobiluncus sp.]|uniref:hypothetical protein n=1 Tax=uncultured Mobiluncus sp. TaxID=293425 RepID=UPI0026062828|nr:hypothetical protein [uncultured Mobiluncus sp.]
MSATLTPLYEGIATKRLERHLREALHEAQESLAHCRGIPITRIGRTYELTQGAVDALIDALSSLDELIVEAGGLV